MKDYIFLYTQDPVYREKKTKELSLCRLARDRSPGSDFPFYPIGLDENCAHVVFGKNSITLDGLREQYEFKQLPNPNNTSSEVVINGKVDFAEDQVWEDQHAHSKISMAQMSLIKRMSMTFARRLGSTSISDASTTALRQWAFLHYTNWIKKGSTSSLSLTYYCRTASADCSDLDYTDKEHPST